MASILVTGGAGYIGSHCCLELLAAGHDIVVFDNLINSHAEALDRVRRITGCEFSFVKGDIRDRAALDAIFAEYECDTVIHFAGLKAVGASVEQPLQYYENNVVGTCHLLQAMMRAEVRKIIFSSSATVYGVPKFLPLTEEHPLSTTNPYGQTKLMIEEMLRDLAVAQGDMSIGILRYFNPVGAHESGLIGEDPNDIPNNLMPFIAQVAVGKRDTLSVFGDDYETVDGTGIRDYIHVVDLAKGHLAALNSLDKPGCVAVNLGTGCGYSVLEMVLAFEAASGRKVPYKVAPRRSGDVAQCYADPAFAAELLGWRAERSLGQMCEDHWKWQHQNPNGYEG